MDHPETSQEPTRNQPETIQKPASNQTETSQQPTTNQSAPNQKPASNQSDTSQQPTRNQPVTKRSLEVKHGSQELGSSVFGSSELRSSGEPPKTRKRQLPRNQPETNQSMLPLRAKKCMRFHCLFIGKFKHIIFTEYDALEFANLIVCWLSSLVDELFGKL